VIAHRARLALIVGALTSFAWSAHAQEGVRTRSTDVDDLGTLRYNDRRFESPQHVALEFRFGRYVPDVDSEFTTATPYETTFGSDNRYSVGLEVDWQLWRIPYVGTLGPGFAFQYTKMSAASFITATGARAGEDTNLAIFPMYLTAVLRVDQLARETPIPIVPYAKLGLGAALWNVTNGGGVANASGVRGSGISYGPQFALGGMLLLDIFDSSSAKSLDNEIGINNSYFFMEWYVSRLGAGDQMEVGTNTWVLGLAFEI
jgi:hypothetical protein